jgi:hypothetical protein
MPTTKTPPVRAKSKVRKKRPSSELYADLAESIREMGAYLRGEPTNMRITRVIGETPTHVIWEELQPKPRTYKVRKPKNWKGRPVAVESSQ